MKYIRWILDNILFVLTAFLLVFIPLYPKKPLLDIVNTWVYIRAEDFVVVLILFVWVVQLFRNKITLKTPLTIPILLFWIAGAIATIHGVLIVFPDISDVYPNVAFLSYLRRIEYVSMFFIAYSSMKEKRFLPAFIVVLVTTLLCVCLYGLGQKYLGFPAYLTMNEEFAKGVPIRLSSLSRVSSTFGGHYDLAAYLVLLIPIAVSLVFGVRHWFLKFALLLSAFLGFGVLFMTVSRVSFFAVVVALLIILFFQKKKLVLFSIPVIAICAIVFVTFTPALLERFGNTVKEVDVLVEAKTGNVIGHPTEVPSDYFKDKFIKQSPDQTVDMLDEILIDDEFLATNSAVATQSAAIPYTSLPPYVLMVSADNKSTGENLPQGTGYINLPLSAVTRRVGHFFYDTGKDSDSPQTPDVFIVSGDFLIKRALAYDLSFTTRFQGEWPKALVAFRRNILFGSGYASVSLAVDNNYLRVLAETGLVGFIAFFALFIAIGISIRKILPDVNSALARSFILGYAAGAIGLLLNAVLIDVFEASKIAFYFWLLTGITIGLLHSYQKTDSNLAGAFKSITTSSYAIVVYLFIATYVLFSPMLGNYFTGDDFTWFRWIADCDHDRCGSIFSYFTESDGFFYRPGTKVYFWVMYNIFWLNQIAYHTVSIFLHFIVSVLVFLLSKKLFRSFPQATLASFLFLILSGFSEALFWISATGFLFTAVFSLTSLLFFVLWEERKKTRYLVVSLLSLVLGFCFHELGSMTPLLLVLYKITMREGGIRNITKNVHYLLLALPIVPYLLLRYSAQSHWFSGDYNYNLLKLPFNVVGNAVGYLLVTLAGPVASPLYQFLRTILREHLMVACIVVVTAAVLIILLYKLAVTRLDKDEKRIVTFGVLFFLIALLPFLGLGNMTSRYSYLASVGVSILLVFGIKKIYTSLLGSGRSTALMSISVVVAVFAIFHSMQIQQIQGDWYNAGQKVKNFLIAIDGSYQDEWATESMKFYFVDVPIRSGEAWVFPVGLADGLWFSFRNPNIAIYQFPTVREAMSAVTHPERERVFVFDGSGRVTEQKKMNNGLIYEE